MAMVQLDKVASFLKSDWLEIKFAHVPPNILHTGWRLQSVLEKPTQTLAVQTLHPAAPILESVRNPGRYQPLGSSVRTQLASILPR